MTLIAGYQSDLSPQSIEEIKKYLKQNHCPCQKTIREVDYTTWHIGKSTDEEMVGTASAIPDRISSLKLHISGYLHAEIPKTVRIRLAKTVLFTHTLVHTGYFIIEVFAARTKADGLKGYSTLLINGLAPVVKALQAKDQSPDKKNRIIQFTGQNAIPAPKTISRLTYIATYTKQDL